MFYIFSEGKVEQTEKIEYPPTKGVDVIGMFHH